MEKNWNLCALCERHTGERLVCLLNRTRLNYSSGCRRLAENLQHFSELGDVPIQVALSCLNDGNGIEETLRSHEAKWHKSFFNRCSNLKLQRAKRGS